MECEEKFIFSHKTKMSNHNTLDLHHPLPPSAELLAKIKQNPLYHNFDFYSAQEVSPNLYIGPITSVLNETTLKNMGITHILSTMNIPPLFPSQFEYKVIDLKDLPTEPLLIHLPECFDFIESGIRHGNFILLNLFGRSFGNLRQV
jgi:hypothetical protein